MDDNNEDMNRCPTDGQTSHTDANDGEDNDAITMLDVLQEEQDLEDDAFAVLAGSDDQNCTYLKGYVSRQALYACNTCQLVATSADDTSPPSAAICLACSYRCHDGHELIELYTKRNFRCDCGNEKFAENKCKLYSKTSINELNQYNQNFKGLYCLCLRPYPDPDSDVDDEMIQCVVCEDWFHGRHLSNVPENQDFSEMICRNCMTRLPFLSFYNNSFGEKVIIEKAETSEDIDISSTEPKSDPKAEPSVPPKELAKIDPSVVTELDSGIESSCDSVESSAKPSECKLKAMKSSSSYEPPEQFVPTYWPLEWRKSLCQCSDCMRLYRENRCLFLCDEKDMVHYYETEGIKANNKVSHYDRGLNELKKMDRTQAIEIINGYNDFSESLKEFLKSFAESKKTVREEDIKAFFEEMGSRKRQKVDIPYNCK